MTIEDEKLSLVEIATDHILNKADFKYNPGVAFKEALPKILAFLIESLNTPGDPVYRLFSIDPGLGKSRLIKGFLRSWKANGFLPTGSILVCLATIEEINSYVAECQFDDADYAVVTADAYLGKLGLGIKRSNEARVLFTTHQMIYTRTSKGLFCEAKCFHYNSGPRSLRIWDEGCLPSQNVTIREDELGALPVVLRSVVPDFVRELDAFLSDVSAMKRDDALIIPREIGWAFKASVPHKGRAWQTLTRAQRDLQENLALMGGRTMTMAVDSRDDRTLVGCSRSLPEDFAPAFIFDASGRVRATYGLWEAYGKDLKREVEIATDYRRANVHLWRRGSGRSTLEKPESRQPILEELAKLIASKPDESFLVVHYKQNAYMDIAAELSRMTGSPARLRFVHWGAHRATNAYREAQNIILLGAWLWPDAAYTALHMAASGLPSHRIGNADRALVREGELKNNLLQAGSRGQLRNVEDGVCGPCNVYLILSPMDCLESLVQDALPGSNLIEWEPIARGLTGNGRLVADLLDKVFADTLVNSITKKEVVNRASLTGAQTLTKVLSQLPFKSYFNAIGLISKGQRIWRATALLNNSTIGTPPVANDDEDCGAKTGLVRHHYAANDNVSELIDGFLASLDR